MADDTIENPVAAEVEAQAIRLIAEYHWTTLSREDFDTKIDSLEMPPNMKRAYKMFRQDLMQAEDTDAVAQVLKDPPPVTHTTNKRFADGLRIGSSYEEYNDFVDEYRTDDDDQQAEELLASVTHPGKKSAPPSGSKRKRLSPSRLAVPKRTRPSRKSHSPSRYSDFHIESPGGRVGRGRDSGGKGKGRSRDEDEDEVEDDDEEEEEEDVDLEGDEEEDDDEVDEDLEEEDEDLEEEDEELEEDQFSQDTEEGGLSPTARRLKKQKGKGKAVVGKGKPGKQKTNLTSSKGKGKSSSAQGGGKRKGSKKTVSSTSKRGRSGVVKITPLTAQEHVEFDAASGSKPVKVTKAPKDKLTLSRAAQDSVDGIPLKAKGYFGFKFSHMEVEDGKIREKWTCLYCKDDKSVPKGKNNNLSNHRGCCPFNQTPNTAGLEPFYPKGLKRPSNEASNVSDTGGSYRGLPLMGWLSGQQILSVPLVRRMGLIEIVTDALPFTHMASPAHIALVSSIDPKAVAACVSNSSVRRDLELFNEQMKIEVMRTLNEHDSLVILQHDAWTMRGYRFAFVAIIATYVDRDWNYRSLLLSFKVLDTRHSGANFAGHLVETIKEFHLEEKWSGLIVSDSASPNRRMAAVIRQQLADRGEKVRYLARCLHGPGEADGDEEAEDGSSNPFAQATHDIESSETPPSISAFPKASRRCNFVWRADDCGILCFAHHLNIAVRDGFRAMGIKFAAQMKVIPIPDIIEPSNGPGLQALDDLEPAADEDERDAGVVAEEEDDEEVEE